MRTSLFLLITFVVMAVSVTAQNLEWSKMFGSNSSDIGYSIEELSSGEVIIMGEVSDLSGDINSHYGELDVWVAKLDVNGNFIWKKNLGGTKSDMARSISVDGNDNIYITGWSYSTDYDIIFNSSFTHKNFLIKLNSAGDIIWVKNYPVPNEDRTLFYHVNVLEDDKIFLSGYVEYSGNSNHDTYSVLVNSNGDVIWENLMSGYLDGSSSTIDNNGNVFSLTDNDKLHKFDLQGNNLWTQSYINNTNDIVSGPYTILWDGLNLIFVDQISVDSPSLHFETRLLRVNSNGDLLSTITLLNNYFSPEDLLSFENMQLVLLGKIGMNVTGDLNSGIMSISTSGQIIYDALNNGGSNWDRLYRGLKHSNGSYYAIGKSDSNDGDCSGSIDPNANDDDIWIVKFNSNLSVKNIEESNSRIFPNPTLDNLEIQIFNSESIADLEVYDHIGSKVLFTRLSEDKINVSQLKSGIYTLKIIDKAGNICFEKFQKI